MSGRGAWSGPAGLAAVALAAGAAGFVGYGYWAEWRATQDAAPQLRPDLAFADLDGRTRQLSEWDGRLVLLNFWATWCTPCLKEIPLLVRAQAEHGARGLQVVGIAMNTPDEVRAFAPRFDINYPLLVGQAEVMLAMDALGDPIGAFPFSVLIAPDGRILERVSGDLSEEELAGLLARHLV